MRGVRFENLIRPNRVYRVIAVFFLLFTCIDLACPSLCEEELGGMTKASRIQNAPDYIAAQILNDGEQPNSHDSKSSVAEEDCFCCCPHLQPSYRLITPTLHVNDRQFSFLPVGLPTPPSISAYHPPRLASC